MRKRIIPLGIICFVVLPFFHAGYCRAAEPKVPKLTVFYSPTCHSCQEAKRDLMPKIEREFGNRIVVEYLDITDLQNYKFMLGLQEKYLAGEKKILPVFFMGGNFLDGADDLEKRLPLLIRESLGREVKEELDVPRVDLIGRFAAFKPLAVAAAALLDGINPCAFTVIVFFVSFLAVQGYRKKELAWIGLSFIFAVFITYLLIGLGIFDFIYRLKGFRLALRVINSSIGIFSILLGALCLYDFFRFRKTRQTEGMVLQLPKSIKARIQGVIGLHYRARGQTGEGPKQGPHVLRLVSSAFVTGSLVSILEAVCTGQVYLPTITFVLKTTRLKLEALGYLLLYNFIFIVPMLAILILALLGVTSGQFAHFFKKHLLAVKMLMALLFFGLGVLLIWRV